MIKLRKNPILDKEWVMPTDMDELLLLAKKWGADNVALLEVKDVLIDPRVRFKCMVPKCYMSGGCSHCPPNGWSIDEVREIVGRHTWAIFFRVKVPPSIIAAKGLGANIAGGVMDDAGNLMNLGGHYMLAFTIARLLQKTARDMGYRSEAVYGAGNCRDALCHFQPNCRQMATGKCRHPGLSAPSMESCGMNAFKMGAIAGWDVFPIGGTCGPESVGTGSLMGLALIGPVGKGQRAERHSKAPLSDPDPVTRQGAEPAENIRRVIRDLSRNRAAYSQANVKLSQAPALLRQSKLWIRLTKNMRELSGSWLDVASSYKVMFAGRPKKS